MDENKKKVQRLEVFVQLTDMGESSCCRESIREVLDELVQKLSAFGEESFFMSANVDESRPYVSGSKKGLAYMKEYAGVPKGFIPFLKEEQVKSAGNRTTSFINTVEDRMPISSNLTSRKIAIEISETNRISTEKGNEEVWQRGEQDDSRKLQDRSTETERATVDQTSLAGPEIGLQVPTAEPRPDGKGERKPDTETVPNIEISAKTGGFQDIDVNCKLAHADVNILKISSNLKPGSGRCEDDGFYCKGITNHTHASVEGMVTRNNAVSGFPANRDLEDADTDNTINIPNIQSVCCQTTRSADDNYDCSYRSGNEQKHLDYDSRLDAREKKKLSSEETRYVTDNRTVTTTKKQTKESELSDDRGAVPGSIVSSLYVTTHNLSEGRKEIRSKDPKSRHTGRQNVNIRDTETGHTTVLSNTNENKSADFQPTLPKLASIKKRFKCPKCHKTFKFRTQLNKHHCLKVAKQNVPGKQTFSRDNNKISNPKRPKSAKERKYKCHYCEKRFQAKSHLDEHETCIHTKEYMYKCSLCSEKFVQRSKFPNHKKACEAKYPGKTCKFDKLNTTREKAKRTICKRLRNRGNNPNVHFDGCSIQRKNESYRDKDILNVMNENQKSMLKNITASSTKVGDKLQCSECDTLMRSDRLKSHIISKHIGKLLFACFFCDRRFTFAQNARRHLRDRCKEKYTKGNESQGNNMSVNYAQPLTNKNEKSISARLSEILSDSSKDPLDSQEYDNESVTDIFAEDSSQDSDFDVDGSSQENKPSAKKREAPLDNRTTLTGAFATKFDPDQHNCAVLDDTERMGTGNASAEIQFSSKDVSAVNAFLQDEKSNDNNVSDCQNNPFQLSVTGYDSDSDRESYESDDSDLGEYIEMEMEEILNDENNATASERRIKPPTKVESVDSRIIDEGSDVGTLRSCKRKRKEEEFTSRSKMGTKWNTLKGKNTAKNVPQSSEVVNLMTEVHKKEVESIKASSKQMDGSYKCEKCKKVFKPNRSGRFSEHIISRHLQKKMFACGLCKKRLASARTVAEHLKRSCKKKVKSSSANKENSSDA